MEFEVKKTKGALDSIMLEIVDKSKEESDSEVIAVHQSFFQDPLPLGYID
ncbi:MULTISPECIES: hypothetical protein [Bacillus]|nr:MULTISPECIES: hypothetical protein [Bacillus]MDH3081559.1 hypothetical protein [Bacillus amyloliquefaciens]MDU0074942.1 hypothetical protein [Bacillus sp. IG2]MDU0100652.1 hypothetical protein [Bacillus sp. IS1]MEC2272686.1 hypothetical protein [Bacillus velezensis]MED3680861.1 hypothetical protein [Bacillus velezensis]